MIYTIDTDKIIQLAQEGKNIVLTPEAEKQLLQLLDAKEYVEKAIDVCKEAITTEALKLNPNFSSITGEKVRVGFRQYGAKYKIDESKLDEVPENMYTANVTAQEVDRQALGEIKDTLNELSLPFKVAFSVEAKEVEKFVKEHKALPDGINEIERPKTMSITKKGEGNDNDD